jgi:hypothetical protein
MKFITVPGTIRNFFLVLWVIFALLDPSPDCGSGSGDPIESGSNPDPDPQHWYRYHGIQKFFSFHFLPRCIQMSSSQYLWLKCQCRLFSYYVNTVFTQFLYKLNSSKRYSLTLERVLNADNGSSSFRLNTLAFSAFHSSVFLSIIHCLISSLSQLLPTAALSPADAPCALTVRIEVRNVPSGDLKAAVSPLRHSIVSHNQFSVRILIYMCNA